jgi:hypothetical protein
MIKVTWLEQSGTHFILLKGMKGVKSMNLPKRLWLKCERISVLSLLGNRFSLVYDLTLYRFDP